MCTHVHIEFNIFGIVSVSPEVLADLNTQKAKDNKVLKEALKTNGAAVLSGKKKLKNAALKLSAMSKLKKAGLLREEEYKKQLYQPLPSKEVLDKLFDRFDKDKDKKLSLEENQGLIQMLLVEKNKHEKIKIKSYFDSRKTENLGASFFFYYYLFIFFYHRWQQQQHFHLTFFSCFIHRQKL